MLKVLSKNRCSAFHSQAGVQEHTSGEGNAQNRRQLMPALNLSSAFAIAILLEPTSLSNKAAQSRCGQHSRRFKTRSWQRHGLCPNWNMLPRPPRAQDCPRIEFVCRCRKVGQDINLAFKSDGQISSRLEQQSPFFLISQCRLSVT